MLPILADVPPPVTSPQGPLPFVIAGVVMVGLAIGIYLSIRFLVRKFGPGAKNKNTAPDSEGNPDK